MIRSIAPLRIGLAGGGTDTSPYCEQYGGYILNASINRFAHCSIIPTNNNLIKIISIDKDKSIECASQLKLEYDGQLDLIKAVYNRIINDYIKRPLSFEIFTSVDALPGSGLGSSSTLVVAILEAFATWLNIPLGKYDLAHLAYEIERVDLGYAGGKQDQYAATFGGVNFMEFYSKDRVIVNPLRIAHDTLNEINNNLLLYFTGISRVSGEIINDQSKNITSGKMRTISGMHGLKVQAIQLKKALLLNELDKFGELLDYGWKMKKQLTHSVTNSYIDNIYRTAKEFGASGGKVSGAGGGGFMILYCPGNTKYPVKKAISENYNGTFKDFQFYEHGSRGWKI